MGCFEYCHLCREQCDVIHKESDLENEKIHKINHGHRIQAFGGNKSYGDDKAITVTCNELRENDQVVYKNREINWATFKNEEFSNWSFDVDSSTLKALKLRNVKIWNLIGKDICHEYNKR